MKRPLKFVTEEELMQDDGWRAANGLKPLHGPSEAQMAAQEADMARRNAYWESVRLCRFAGLPVPPKPEWWNDRV